MTPFNASCFTGWLTTVAECKVLISFKIFEQIQKIKHSSMKGMHLNHTTYAIYAHANLV